MRTSAQRSGDAAEVQVATYLARLGWQLLGTHVRVGRAEIDLVATDPGPPAALVIVEVRWRARRDYGLPEETIDHRKRSRLHRAGYALRERGSVAGGDDPGSVTVPDLPLRFDLIVAEPGNRLRHYQHGI